MLPFIGCPYTILMVINWAILLDGYVISSVFSQIVKIDQ